MKKFLLATTVFMGIVVMASAQESTGKKSTQTENEKAKAEKAAYQKNMAEKEHAEKRDTERKEAENATDVKLKLQKERAAKDEENAAKVQEVSISAMDAEMVSEEGTAKPVSKKVLTDEERASEKEKPQARKATKSQKAKSKQ